MKLLTDNSFISKWSEQILGYGFTAVPNLLLRHRRAIGLTSTECLVIIAIDSFRWTSQDPWPSLEALSKRCGYSPRTLTRTITSLEEKNVIRRVKRPGTSNSYDLSPLIYWLDHFAETELSDGGDKSGSTRTDKTYQKRRTPLSPKEYSYKNIHKRKKLSQTPPTKSVA